MKLSNFSSKKIEKQHLNPIVGGSVNGVTSSKGSTTMSSGADTDPRGNDTDSGDSGSGLVPGVGSEIVNP